jgi:hypothetical protein
MVWVWFRKGEDTAVPGAGLEVSRATACRRIAEGIAVLAAQRRDLYQGLRRPVRAGRRRLRRRGSRHHKPDPAARRRQNPRRRQPHVERLAPARGGHRRSFGLSEDHEGGTCDGRGTESGPARVAPRAPGIGEARSAAGDGSKASHPTPPAETANAAPNRQKSSPNINPNGSALAASAGSFRPRPGHRGPLAGMLSRLAGR